MRQGGIVASGLFDPSVRTWPPDLNPGWAKSGDRRSPSGPARRGRCRSWFRSRSCSRSCLSIRLRTMRMVMPACAVRASGRHGGAGGIPCVSGATPWSGRIFRGDDRSPTVGVPICSSICSSRFVPGI